MRRCVLWRNADDTKNTIYDVITSCMDKMHNNCMYVQVHSQTKNNKKCVHLAWQNYDIRHDGIPGVIFGEKRLQQQNNNYSCCSWPTAVNSNSRVLESGYDGWVGKSFCRKQQITIHVKLLILPKFLLYFYVVVAAAGRIVAAVVTR